MGAITAIGFFNVDLTGKFCNAVWSGRGIFPDNKITKKIKLT